MSFANIYSNLVRAAVWVQGKVDPVTYWLADKMTNEYHPLLGRVEMKGSLEKTDHYETTSNSGTVGKVGQNGLLMAYTRHKSNTVVTTSRSISALRIAGTQLINVPVENTAIYELLYIGNNVGCVFNSRSGQLMCLVDYSANTSIGKDAGLIDSDVLYAYGFFAIAVFSGVIGFSNLVDSAGFGIFMIALASIMVILARSVLVADAASKRNWQQAIYSLGRIP